MFPADGRTDGRTGGHLDLRAVWGVLSGPEAQVRLRPSFVFNGSVSPPSWFALIRTQCPGVGRRGRDWVCRERSDLGLGEGVRGAPRDPGMCPLSVYSLFLTARPPGCTEGKAASAALFVGQGPRALSSGPSAEQVAVQSREPAFQSDVPARPAPTGLPPVGVRALPVPLSPWAQPLARWPGWGL